MDIDKVLERIKKEKAIAIIRGVGTDDILDTAKAIKEGGISNMEITFNHNMPGGISETLDSIRQVRSYFGESVNVGAGTVLTPEEVQMSVEAGAGYMISPNVDPDVISATIKAGKVSIPGAFTPSEACIAYKNGAHIIKMFPAGLLGLNYLKAMRGPLKHIPMCAVGGISPENIEEFLVEGIRCFGIGGNLVSLDAIKKRDFRKLTKTAVAYRTVLDRYES